MLNGGGPIELYLEKQGEGYVVKFVDHGFIAI